MLISTVLRNAVKLSFGRKWLWFPAFLFTLALDLPGIIIRPFLPPTSDLTNLEIVESWLTQFGDLTQNIPLLVGGLFGFSVLFGALWAVATIGQAVLIEGVVAEQEGLEIAQFEHWRKGRSLLGRFIAIDTIILFPLFINLFLIVLLLGGISGSLVLTLREGGATSISPIVGILGTLLIPLFCLILPLGIAAFVYRLIAFRFAALRNMPIRESIRAVAPFLRQHGLMIAFLLLLTWAFSYGINGGMLVIGRGLETIFGERIVLSILFVFVSLIVATFKNLIVSATWTLAILTLDRK